MEKDKEFLKKLVIFHQKYRFKETINLIPSENICSPEVRLLLGSDLLHRYTSDEGFYRGTKYIDEIESFGKEIAKELFNAKFVSLRMISGHIALFTFLLNFSTKGDKILCISPKDGGYPGLSEEKLPNILGLKVMNAAVKNYKIDLNSTIEVIEKNKIKIAILGSSLILFKQPVKELAKLNIIVGYDGSHVLGLIAGQTFQDPLKEGASALFGSTHKSFFGPQGGIFLSNEDLEIDKMILHKLVDNAHWNRIAALTWALLEMKHFGKEYAHQIIKNSQALAKNLYERKFPIAGEEYGFTESHQVLMIFQDYKKNMDFAKKLEEANIIVDCGIRLGVNEVTRRGMKEKEMERIAELIERVYKGEDIEKVRQDVIKLRKEFDDIEYRFKDVNLNYLIEELIK
jgi:glycine hydroxymethyltransferase